MFERTVRNSIQATARVLFPENELSAPDWRQTDVVGRTLTYFEQLPPSSRGLLKLLFVTVELGAPLLALGLRRFSKRRPEVRLENIRRWRHSRWYLLRVIGDSLKAVLTMMYLSHPLVIAHLGAYKHCGSPDGSSLYPLKEGHLE